MTTYTLKFEVSPDPTGAAGDTAFGEVLYAVPRTGLSLTSVTTFVTLGSNGDGTYHWQLKTIDVSSFFDPDDTRISIERTGGFDSIHIRRLRVEGSDGSLSYGGWPDGYHYTAAHQDGLLGRQYLGQDIGVGAGDNRGEQYELAVADYINPGRTLDWYFTPAPGGWAVGSIRMNR